jgi:hypothetical protein
MREPSLLLLSQFSFFRESLEKMFEISEQLTVNSYQGGASHFLNQYPGRVSLYGH